VLTICSQCKRVISESPPLDGKVSHGICQQCLEILERHIKHSKKPSEHSLVADPAGSDEYE
jgi:hypothetical protein